MEEGVRDHHVASLATSLGLQHELDEGDINIIFKEKGFTFPTVVSALVTAPELGVSALTLSQN